MKKATGLLRPINWISVLSYQEVRACKAIMSPRDFHPLLSGPPTVSIPTSQPAEARVDAAHVADLLPKGGIVPCYERRCPTRSAGAQRRLETDTAIETSDSAG